MEKCGVHRALPGKVRTWLAKAIFASEKQGQIRLARLFPDGHEIAGGEYCLTFGKVHVFEHSLQLLGETRTTLRLQSRYLQRTRMSTIGGDLPIRNGSLASRDIAYHGFLHFERRAGAEQQPRRQVLGNKTAHT